ncbi:MAG TPA: ComEC/Rec2 family competence protein [Flexilinea sp.]|jgi:competence protein ComEC|nr:ComEC/Rec2 family competence protein [Flexilinea sp.]HPJ64249.1 ComEC/Rec2 family competence protein [Flexilinea sp.]HPR70257.1 ComEC/Rec2 family competence protein [Flexilinea sp.]
MNRTEILLGILAGLFISQKIRVPLPIWLIFLLLFAVLAVFCGKKSSKYVLDQPVKKAAMIALTAAFCCLGGLRGSVTNQPLPSGHLSEVSGEEVSFKGIINRPVTRSDSQTRLRIRLVRNEDSDSDPDRGECIVVLNSLTNSFEYGDLLSVRGKLTKLDASAPNSYGSYLERSGISGILYNPEIELIAKQQGNPILNRIFRLQSYLLQKTYDIFPEPENSLMAGILLGDKSRIPAEIEEAFRNTGTAHIIAISGMNFSVLIWMLLSVLRAFHKRWWTPLILLPFIFFYTILTGANPAIVRAGIMGGIALIGMSIGREKGGVDSLLLSVAAMAMFQPKILFDVGFQLSATATLGILIFNPPLNSLIEKGFTAIHLKNNVQKILLDTLNEILITSFSAQIFTTWIIAASFHQFAIFSLIVNMLIAPFQNLIMVGGVFALFLSILSESLGKIAGLIVDPLPALTIRIICFFGKFDWASQYSDLSNLAAWIIIFSILTVWINRNRWIRQKKETLIQAGITILALFTLVCWRQVLAKADHRLHLTFTGGTNTSSILIRLPESQKILVANGVTNFQAQNLLKKNPFDPADYAAAILDFQEEWMADEYLRSDDEKPEWLILNGRNRSLSAEQTNPTPVYLNEGFQLRTNPFILTLQQEYLKRKRWIISYRSLTIDIPNGIPLHRIDTLNDPNPSVSIILLGKKDNEREWEEYLSQTYCHGSSCSGKPILLSTNEYGTIEVISDGEKIWLVQQSS